MPTISDYQRQYQCVQRELARRKREYPPQVQAGVLSIGEAQRELGTMREVLLTVERILLLNDALDELTPEQTGLPHVSRN